MIETTAGPQINVVRAGPRGGPPVVLLHPLGLDLTWWDHQFADLAADHDVVAFDMPGHGRSGTLATPPTFDLMASVLTSVTEHLAAGPVHLVGSSVGGMIAQTQALARPDLVRSLSLVGTLHTFPAAGRAALRERARVARDEGMTAIVPLSLARWFPAAFRERRPDVLDRAAKLLLQQEPAFHALLWEMVASLDLAERLPSLRVPTLVVTGEEDVNAPVAVGQEIARSIPGATFRAMPGVGHFPPVESPRAFTSELRSFLAEVLRGR